MLPPVRACRTTSSRARRRSMWSWLTAGATSIWPASSPSKSARSSAMRGNTSRGEPGSAAPVATVRLEVHAGVLRRDQAEGARSHGKAPAARDLPRALHGEERLGQRGQQRRVRTVERDRHHLGSHPLRDSRESAHARDARQVGQHGVGVEGRAVVEPHPLAQRERPAPRIPGGPGGGQRRLRTGAVGGIADQRLAHVPDDGRGHEVGGAVGVERHRVAHDAHHQRVDGGGGHRGGERGHASPESSCAISRPRYVPRTLPRTASRRPTGAMAG